MIEVRKKTMLWYLFRVPVYIYRWHLDWLFGKRLLLLTHTRSRRLYWLLGWKYRASETDRRRLVGQIPLLAFRPRPYQSGSFRKNSASSD